MAIHVQIDPLERTATLRGVHSLCAGESSEVILSGVPDADTPTLSLRVYRDASESVQVACSVRPGTDPVEEGLAPVEGRAALRRGTLDLRTSAVSEWASEDAAAAAAADEARRSGSKEPEARAAASYRRPDSAWLVVADSSRVWAACAVPFVLRPFDDALSPDPEVPLPSYAERAEAAAEAAEAAAERAERAAEDAESAESVGKVGRDELFDDPDSASPKVKASLLPSYVDDVLEVAELPASGESGKLYVVTGTNAVYRWGGSSFVEVSPSRDWSGELAGKRGLDDLAAYAMSDWYNGSSASNEVAFRYDETSGEWIGEPGIIYAEGHRLRYNVAEGEWQYVLSSGDVIGLSTNEGAMELRPAGYLVSRPSVYVTTADKLAKTSQLQDRYTKAEADAKFVSSLCINVTWSDLVAMRNSGSLVSGERYRITDYVATTNGDMSSQSANHPFDIIVTADSPSRINEHAMAAQHAGDQYFSDRCLHAWDVWYCIDNDVNRFAWASSSGKGVVYRLVDEWGNDLPYDFKGLRFTRDGVAFYTFDAGYRNGAYVDVDRSLNGSDGYVTGNVMKPYTVEDNSKLMVVRHLNNNVCFGYAVEKNSWDEDCHGNTLGDRNISTANCSFNVFGKECRDNSFGPLFLNNSLGAVVRDCTYVYTGSNPAQDAANPAAWCQGNTIGPYCAGISMVLACSGNVFDYGCLDITLAQNCKQNSFGAGCSGLSLGTSCLRNTFTHGYRSESQNPVIEVPNGTNRKVFTTADDAEATSGALKKVALTGAYSDLVGTPSLDAAVTRTSANPVKSSGIWSAIWGALTALPTGFASLYDWCVSQLRAKRDYGDLSYERQDPSEGGWILHIDGNDVRLLPAGELTWTDTGSETSGTYNLKWLGQWHLAHVTGSGMATCVDQESPEDATELTLVSTSDYETVVATATAVSVDDSLALSSEVAKKQDALSNAQLAAANSGATPAKVTTWDGYAAQIAAKAAAADLRYRIAEAAVRKTLPSDCFPVTFTYEGVSYSVNSLVKESEAIAAGGMCLSAFGDAYSLGMVVGPAGAEDEKQELTEVATFRADGVYESGVDGLQFGGVSPVADTSPTLADVLVLADRTVNFVAAYDETSIDIELPAAVTVDAVRYARDFFLDIDNSVNASDLALEFTGLGVDYAFVPLEDDSISEMMTIGAGERVRLYFTETPYTATGSLPVINVARVTLGDFVTSTTGGNS